LDRRPTDGLIERRPVAPLGRLLLGAATEAAAAYADPAATGREHAAAFNRLTQGAQEVMRFRCFTLRNRNLLHTASP
jgi:hypothetical protein